MMRYLAFATLVLAILATPVFSQSKSSNTAKAMQPSKPLNPAKRTPGEAQALDLLTQAEAEASALDSPMRAWVLWQIGQAYQPIDKTKALNLFHTALSAAH